MSMVGRHVWIVRPCSESDIFNATDFWMLTMKPEIEANLLRVAKRLGADTWGVDRKNRMSSANKQSLC